VDVFRPCRLSLPEILPFHEGPDLPHQLGTRPQVRSLPGSVRDGIPNTGVTFIQTSHYGAELLFAMSTPGDAHFTGHTLAIISNWIYAAARTGTCLASRKLKVCR
jgi:hypothetical protein